MDNLYSQICDIDNIIDMTNKVCSNVKDKRKVDRFESYKMEHVINIKNRLESKNYNFDKYNIFMISDPKYRIVMGQSIEDKVINHLAAKYFLSNVFEPKFIDSMVATRVGKGTSYGIKLMKKYLNDMKRKYDNFYFLKIDIKKYFYNMDHDVLKCILRKNIKDEDALYLLNQIIDLTNKEYINKEINRLKSEKLKYIKDEKIVNEINNIPLYEYGKGSSIGYSNF